MKLLVISIVALNVVLANGFEILTAGVAAGVGLAGKYFFDYVSANQCHFWIKNNVTEFEELFDAKIYGQHIVKGVISRALASHVRRLKTSSGPLKALVISMHGWTGSGKNYVSQIIAESLYQGGITSPFVHTFIPQLHFRDQHEVDIYKMHIQDWIRGNTTQCSQSLFIFDEIDKMPYGLLDAIKPFIDYHPKIDGVDYRRNIFLLLSNTGGRAISNLALETFLQRNQREDIKYEDLEKLILLETYNEIGALNKSPLVDKSLVDLYVPFLPLTRDHVSKCADFEALKEGKTLTSIQRQQLIDRLVFWPQDAEVFSTTGCKRITQVLDQILSEN